MTDESENGLRRDVLEAENPPTNPPTRCLDSRNLLAGDREVMIRHGGSTYWLRSTSKGKLLLTK